MKLREEGKRQCDQKKSPNVYKSCLKMISLEKLKTFTPLQKLPKNVVALSKLLVATGLKSCPKSNKSSNLITLEKGDEQTTSRRRSSCLHIFWINRLDIFDFIIRILQSLVDELSVNWFKAMN